MTSLNLLLKTKKKVKKYMTILLFSRIMVELHHNQNKILKSMDTPNQNKK